MEMNYFKKGYEDQSWGYPLLDHVWGTKKYPKIYQEDYRKGQIDAYKNNNAEKPWFI